jgi:cytochrome c biogenesis protein CcmG/thiol:disulfide interchange protein DsbE
MTRSSLVALVAAAIVWAALPSPVRAQSPVKLAGQVVCSECWSEAADRRAKPYGTEADVACAARCAKQGVPQALAVWEGDTATLYLLERGKLSADMLPYIAKTVEIAGTAREENGTRYLAVDELHVVQPTAARTAGRPAPRTAQSLPVVKVGDDAPDFALDDLDGARQSLGSFEGTKVVLLNFWATWCAPCRKEMPLFVALQREYASRGLQIIAASADDPEMRPAVVKYASESKLGFPIWVGATPDDLARFGFGAAIPATVVVGRDGKIAALYTGIVDEAELRKTIDALVEKS